MPTDVTGKFNIGCVTRLYHKGECGSQDEDSYVKENGDHCPVCLQGCLSGWGLHRGVGVITEMILCAYCGSTWKEVYELTGYVDLLTYKDRL